MTINDTWVPNIFQTPENEMKERLLSAAVHRPQAFKILPVDQNPNDQGTWAKYGFDKSVNLWVNSSHPDAIDMYQSIFHEKKERSMTKALTVQEKQNVQSMLAQNIKAIKSVLPKHLTPERMLRVAYTTIVQSPKLGRCTQISLVNGVIGASVLGLEIGGPLGLAHLVPFKNNRTNSFEATLIVDYKGLIELMYKSPMVKNVSAQPVFERDHFEYAYGTNPFIAHNPYDDGDRGKLIYGYCIVFFQNGGFEFEVVNRKAAMEAKEHSKAKNSNDSPWNTADEWTMWVKTAVRRISKRVPKSPELQRAIAIDKAVDEGKNVSDVIEADFSTVTNSGNNNGDDPEQSKAKSSDSSTSNDVKKPEKESLTELSEEDRKTISNYNAAKEMFPEYHEQALKDLGIEKVNGPEDALKVIKAINQMVDQEA